MRQNGKCFAAFSFYSRLTYEQSKAAFRRLIFICFLCIINIEVIVMPNNAGSEINKDIYTVNELRRIVAPIAKQHNVQSVYLFGSYARGSASSASDIDLCVDAPALRGMFALGSLYADLEDALRKKLDIVTLGSLKYNPDSQFIENLRKEQILLYEQ